MRQSKLLCTITVLLFLGITDSHAYDKKFGFGLQGGHQFDTNAGVVGLVLQQRTKTPKFDLLYHLKYWPERITFIRLIFFIRWNRHRSDTIRNRCIRCDNFVRLQVS